MILAGGRGKRLYPLTANRSKPSVPFGGNFRIVDFTIMNCVLSGLRSIHLLTQYHSVSLDRHRNERWNFLSPELGEFIEIDPPKMRTTTGYYNGTADAIYRNLDLLESHRADLVLVLSGDHIYRADYRRFIESHVKRDADVTVLTGRVGVEQANAFGVIRLGENGRIEHFIEKPTDPLPYATDGSCQINLGVYCFQAEFLVHQLVSDSKKNTAHDFGKNILPDCLDAGAMHSCPLETVCPDDRPYWRDVGTIDSYFQSNMDLLGSPPAFDLRDTRWPRESRFHKWLPTRFPSSCRTVEAPAGNLVSSGCDVAAACLEKSVLSPGVVIGEDCEVRESIVFSGVTLGRGVKLRRVIVEEGVYIPDGVEISRETGGADFTTSPGGVVVVSAGYRFDEPTSRVPPKRDASRETTSRETTEQPLLRAAPSDRRRLPSNRAPVEFKPPS